MLSLTKRLGLILAAILLSSHATVAQPSPRHWLIGWWEGDLQAPGMANPGRVILVTSVAADGNAQGRMGLSGQPLGPAEIRVTGTQVHVVNAIKSVGEFTRQDDDQLVGTLTGKDAKTGTRLNLTRVRAFETHPLVGTWLGDWQRIIGEPVSGQYYLTILGVHGGTVAGEYSMITSSRTFEGPFTGTLSNNTLVMGNTRLSIDGDRMDGESQGQAGMMKIKLVRKK